MKHPQKRPALSEKTNPGNGLLSIPASAATLDGFRAWAASDTFPERGRIAYIDQQIVIDMSPEELETHNKVKEAVSRVIGTLVAEDDLGEFFPDGVLVTNETAGVSNEPDGTFVGWPTSESGRVVFVPCRDELGQFTELQGTPDWVLEVISARSVVKDTRQLRGAYFRAGIPEYWLIDARGESLAFQILVRGARGYRAAPTRDGWVKSDVFSRRFRLQRSRNRAGRWKYQLLVKSS